MKFDSKYGIGDEVYVIAPDASGPERLEGLWPWGPFKVLSITIKSDADEPLYEVSGSQHGAGSRGSYWERHVYASEEKAKAEADILTNADLEARLRR